MKNTGFRWDARRKIAVVSLYVPGSRGKRRRQLTIRGKSYTEALSLYGKFREETIQLGRLKGADHKTCDVLREVRPRLAFLENVPGLLSVGDGPGSARRYFGTVLGDLAELGMDAIWTVLGADDVGAPHRRKRLWILAYLPDTERDELWDELRRHGCERPEGLEPERDSAPVAGDHGAAR